MLGFYDAPNHKRMPPIPKENTMKKTLIALALGATFASAGWSADDAAAGMPEKKVTIDTVPAAVKDGINAGLEGGTIKSIAETKKEGKTAYKVQITSKDGNTVNKWFDDKGVEVKESGKKDDHAGHDHGDKK
jgi:hypothetical protein